MRILILIPLFLAAIIAATAEVAPAPSAPKNPGMSSREIALENLLSERESDKAFEAVIEAAKKNHISDQAVLEARFLYHVDHREDDAIASMLPEVLKQRDLFKIEDSAIFSVKEEWLAVVEYVQAIASLKKGDKEAFKLHITEAFWLSPRQASAFAPHIDRLRLEDAMRQVKIDFDMKLLPLAGGDAVMFRQLMVDKKAMILHFWSPASRECEASMPDFAITAKALNEKGIAMISILSADSSEILSSARKMIEPLGPNFPGAWLMDSKEKSFAQDLRVQTLPDFVLISSDGGVLFNGAPSDDGLWDALKKIDSQIIRPKAAELSE